METHEYTVWNDEGVELGTYEAHSRAAAVARMLEDCGYKTRPLDASMWRLPGDSSEPAKGSYYAGRTGEFKKTTHVVVETRSQSVILTSR